MGITNKLPFTISPSRCPTEPVVALARSSVHEPRLYLCIWPDRRLEGVRRQPGVIEGPPQLTMPLRRSGYEQQLCVFRDLCPYSIGGRVSKKAGQKERSTIWLA